MSHRKGEICRAGASPARVATEVVALQVFLCPSVDAIKCSSISRSSSPR